MFKKITTEPQKLVQYIRDGLIEQEHFGYVVLLDKNRKIKTLGKSYDYPFYLRSCAKPLQASLIVDYKLNEKYSLTEEEIAICCASHAGEDTHIKIIKGLLDKFGVSEEQLKCGIHEPISKTAQKQLIKNNKKCSQIHNNCSGKHAMMLGLCKLNNWDTKTYDQLNHPLQQAIKNKIYELCDLKCEYPITKDGCGVPIHSMPLKNMVIGYLNLFCNKKYEIIKNAFLNNPYLIGGENRTDTIIMKNAETLIAKVGAAGLCTVINTEKEEGFIVKICDSNMEAREIVTMDLLNKLQWGVYHPDKQIKTIHKDEIGYIQTLLEE